MIKLVALTAIAVTVGCLFGMYSAAQRTQPYLAAVGAKRLLLGQPIELDAYARYVNATGRAKVSCPKQTAKTMVALIVGQSNSENHIGQRYGSRDSRVLNFWGGECFVAQDPLLGSSGVYGSVWTELGNRLVSSGKFDQVIIAPVSAKAGSVLNWREGTKGGEVLRVVMRGLVGHYDVTHVLWHHGEADAGKTSTVEYRDALLSVISATREFFPSSGFWVSQASACRERKPDPAVRAAQSGVASPTNRIFPGPDTDKFLSIEDRFDGCHFAGVGQAKIIDEWLRIL